VFTGYSRCMPRHCRWTLQAVYGTCSFAMVKSFCSVQLSVRSSYCVCTVIETLLVVSSAAAADAAADDDDDDEDDKCSNDDALLCYCGFLNEMILAKVLINHQFEIHIGVDISSQHVQANLFPISVFLYVCVCVCLLFCCILCCLLFMGFLYFCSVFSFSTLILLVGSFDL